MNQTVKKLNDKVEISGDLLTRMYNFVCMEGKYAEVVEIIGKFNEEVKNQMSEVDLSEITKENEGKEDKA